MSRIKITATCFILLALGNLKAQYSINSGGFDAVSTGGSVSASMGQLVNNQYSSANGIIQEGVQLPQELLTLQVNRTHATQNLFSFYPNPSNGLIYIKSNKSIKGNIQLKVLDNAGRMIETMFLKGDQSCLDLTTFAPGIYTLVISEYEHTLSISKIIRK
jgi:hypothetical protein